MSGEQRAAAPPGRRHRSRPTQACPFAPAGGPDRWSDASGQEVPPGDDRGHGRWPGGPEAVRRDTPPPCLAAEPVIDEGRFAELCDVIGPEHVAAIFSAFCDSVVGSVDDMRAAMRAADDAALHEAAHRLKGSAGMLGLSRLEAVLKAVCVLSAGKGGAGNPMALSVALDAAVGEALDAARERAEGGGRQG